MPPERRGTTAAVSQQTDALPGAFPDDPEEANRRNPTFSLTRALKARKDEYIRPRKLRVRVGTWNVAAITGTELDLGDWFVADGLGKSSPSRSNEAKSMAVGRLNNLTNRAGDTSNEQHSRNDEQEIDLYVLGLQEVVDVNSPTEALRPFTDNGPAYRWKEAVQHAIPEYNLVSSQQMVGLLLLIYASPSLSPLVTSVNSCSVGTGLMGYMGNKGAVCTRVVVGGTTRLVFINCHLAAGNDDASLSRRNWDAAQIASRIAFDPVREEDEVTDDIVNPESDNNPPAKLGDEEFAFWFGDFNYRLEDIPGDDLRRLLHLHAHGKYRQHDQPSASQLQKDSVLSQSSSGLPMPELFETDADADDESDAENGLDTSLSLQDHDLETDLDPSSDPTSLATTLASLLPHDQLRRQQAKKQAFQQGWREGEISFLPTYKYDIGQTGVFDSSKKQRAPSWCDRILYRSKEDWEAFTRKMTADHKNKRKGDEPRQLRLGHEVPKSEQKKKSGSDDDIIFDYDFESDDIVAPQAKSPSDTQSSLNQFDRKPVTSSGYFDYDEDEDAASQGEVAVENETAKLITYRSFQDIVSSDHKPIIADFVLSINSVDPELKNTIAREVARELDKAENESRPAITVVIDPVLPDPGEMGMSEGNDSENRLRMSKSDDEQDIIRFGKLYYGAPKTRSLTIANTGGVDAIFRFFDPSSQPGQDAESPFWLKIQPDTEAQQVSQSPAVYTLPPGAATTVSLTIEISDIDMLRTLNMSKEPCPEIEYVIVLRLKGGRDHFIPLSGIWMRTGVPIERPSISHQGMLFQDSKIPINSSRQRGLTSRQLLEASDETSSSGSSDSESSDSENASDSGEQSDNVDSPQHERSSDDESDEDGREEEAITTVRGRRKPEIRRVTTSGLRDRLSAFLPALRAANEELEGKKDNKDIRLEVEEEDDDDDNGSEEESKGPYIEMVSGIMQHAS